MEKILKNLLTKYDEAEGDTKFNIIKFLAAWVIGIVFVVAGGYFEQSLLWLLGTIMVMLLSGFFANVVSLSQVIAIDKLYVTLLKKITREPFEYNIACETVKFVFVKSLISLGVGAALIVGGLYSDQLVLWVSGGMILSIPVCFFVIKLTSLVVISIKALVCFFRRVFNHRN